MTQQMLILFAIFADQANDTGNTLEQTQSQEAMAVFAFFIFLVYASFGSMLAVFRQDIIKQGKDNHHFLDCRCVTRDTCATEVMQSDMDYDQGQMEEDHGYHEDNQI